MFYAIPRVKFEMKKILPGKTKFCCFAAGVGWYFLLCKVPRRLLCSSASPFAWRVKVIFFFCLKVIFRPRNTKDNDTHTIHCLRLCQIQTEPFVFSFQFDCSSFLFCLFAQFLKCALPKVFYAIAHTRTHTRTHTLISSPTFYSKAWN